MEWRYRFSSSTKPEEQSTPIFYANAIATDKKNGLLVKAIH
jgi:hypothetical protein